MSTTRRSFLSAAAGVAGLSALGVESASAKVEPTPWGIKLGIASYTYRSFPREKAIENSPNLSGHRCSACPPSAW